MEHSVQTITSFRSGERIPNLGEPEGHFLIIIIY